MRWTRSRVEFVCGVLALAVPPAAAPAAGPATAPSTAPAGDDARVARAVAELGSGDFRSREEAARVLWSLGEKALPALKEAAAGDDPEAARRASAIIYSITNGVSPDTPKPVLDLLDQYRTAGPQQKPAILQALAALDVDGARMLLKLATGEADANLRREGLKTLEGVARPVARPAAVRLIGEGDVATAGRMLAAVAPLSEPATRDYTAFLAARGGVDDELRRLDPAGPAAPGEAVDPAVRKAYLYRAKRDPAAAVRTLAPGPGAAATSPLLTDALLAEAGDWKALAARAEERGVNAASLESLGFAAAFHRLAGDAAGADKWAAKIAELPNVNPLYNWASAEVLFLNDRPALALDVLRRQGLGASAIDFLVLRLENQQALDLVTQARASGSPMLPQAEARSAAALHFLGRKKDAAAALDAALDASGGPVAFGIYLTVIETGHLTNQPPDRLDAWCVAALQWSQPGVPVGMIESEKVFQKSGFDNPERADQWWKALRETRRTEPPAATFARVKAMDRRELSADDLKGLADRLRAAAARLSPAERDAKTLLAAETLRDFGQAGEAVAVLEKWADVSATAEVLTGLGDAYAKAGRWADAADAYRRAYERDRTQPAPLLLRGRALVQAGRADQGRELIEQAHTQPLADDAARHALMRTLAERGLADEVLREADLIVRTAAPGSWEYGDALRRLGEAAYEGGEFLAAADTWDRAFLKNLNEGISFVDPQANLMIPVRIHRARAQGMAKAGRLAEALAEAKFCFESCPGDADGQIAIVNTLRDAGHAREADAVYDRAKAAYAKIAADNPASGPAHNLVAWLEGSCRRDLDDALAHAKRAAELDPDSTAVLDTLAEVHFQRGEFDPALDLVRKCLKLEPTSSHHQKNLERFEAAKAGTATRPSK